MIPQRRKKKRSGYKKSGSKTLRKIIRVKITNDRMGKRIQRALRRVGIPSKIMRLKKGKYLDLRPKSSTRKIIKRNIALRRITARKK